MIATWASKTTLRPTQILNAPPFLFFFPSLQVKQSSIRSSAVAALSDDDEYDSDEY